MLQERCAGADTISLVARLLRRSKVNLQSMLQQNNGAVVEDFYAHMVCFHVTFWKFHVWSGGLYCTKITQTQSWLVLVNPSEVVMVFRMADTGTIQLILNTAIYTLFSFSNCFIIRVFFTRLLPIRLLTIFTTVYAWLHVCDLGNSKPCFLYLECRSFLCCLSCNSYTTMQINGVILKNRRKTGLNWIAPIRFTPRQTSVKDMSLMKRLLEYELVTTK